MPPDPRHRAAGMPALPPPDAAPPGARAIADGEPGWPAGLRALRDPPPVVFVLGADPPRMAHTIAIVGSRAASEYGRRHARRLAGDLARLGYTIVSGLAHGIDAAAHRGALDAGGRTVAVIPSGLDAITPRHHVGLAAEIAGRGTVLTERESGPPPGKSSFIKRNRLIAALASATVVVEAAERSGALTTAEYARRLARPVLAFPGDVERETARGCHALIRGGAALCESAGDVLEAIRLHAAGAAATTRAGSGGARAAAVHRRDRPAAAPSSVGPGGDAATPEARLLAALGAEPLTVETLARAAGVSVPEALAALLALEWAGAARARPGQRWTRHG